jgi:hypothetical protein
VYIDQCGNKWSVVLHSCIVSHIVAITNRLVLLTSLFPDTRGLEEYPHLSIPLSGKGEEVRFA